VTLGLHVPGRYSSGVANASDIEGEIDLTETSAQVPTGYVMNRLE